MKNEIKHTSHSTYRLEAHVVFAPKYYERYCKAKNVAVYVSLLRAWNVFVYDDIYRKPVRRRYRTRYDKLGWRNNLCGRNGSDKQFDSQKDELGIRAL